MQFPIEKPESGIEAPEPGATSIRFGPAFLRPSSVEKGHYELMRPIITVKNEGDRTVTEAHPEPIGPLAIYRRKRRNENIDMKYDPAGPPPEMKTYDPTTMTPIDLVLVWWPEKGEGEL